MPNNTRESYAQYSRYFNKIREEIDKKPVVRASLELLLTLLTISFFVAFAIRPTANTIADLLANIRSQEEVKQKLDEKISNLKKARQLWTQEEKRLALLDEAMPKDPQPDKYLRQVEGLAALTSVSITSYAVEETNLYGQEEKKPNSESQKTKTSTQKTRIAFSASGSYSNLVSFLENLETMRKIILVESVSLDQKKSTGNQPELVLKVIAETPFKTN